MGDEIVRACDRHSNTAATLWKHVTKYKHMRKWMIEFLRKSESRGDKITPVNSIYIENLTIYFNFVLVLVCCDVDIVKLTVCAPSIDT